MQKEKQGLQGEKSSLGHHYFGEELTILVRKVIKNNIFQDI